MLNHTPSHLASAPKKRGHLLSRLATILLVGIVMVLLLFFLGIGFKVYPRSFDSAADSAADEPDTLQIELQMEEKLAAAQAEIDAMAAEQSVPTTLEDLDGVTVDLLPLNEYSRPGVALEAVHAIAVHYTGNPGTTAQQNRDYFASLAETGEESVSSHFVIGMDGTIIQCIPLDEKSYCTNNRNFDTISIECCHPDADGQFTEETRDALISLVRYLVEGYGLDYDGVIRHYDVTGKLCPLYYVKHEEEWIALKDEIFAED